MSWDDLLISLFIISMSITLFGMMGLVATSEVVWGLVK